MIRRNCCLKTLCLVGSLVCLTAGSFCFGSCPGSGGACLLSYWDDTLFVAGSFGDGTPVCTRWSEQTCLNLYDIIDVNGLQAVAYAPSITITYDHIVGAQARQACGDNADPGLPCDGCPPAKGQDGGSDWGEPGTATSYKKCCLTSGNYACP